MANEKQPLRISFIYDDSLDGAEGVSQYVKTVGSWLSDRGHLVSYLVGETKIRSYNSSPVYSLSKNLKVRFNGNKLSVPLPVRASRVKSALTSANPDVVHLQMPHSPFMAQKVINRLPGRVAAVGTFHIFPANTAARWGSRLLKFAYLGGLARLDKVLSVSSAAQAFAHQTFGIQSDIVPNTIDLKKFKTATSNQPGRIVFLGRLVPRKGARELIIAFQLVAKDNPEAELVIGGSGAQRAELEALVERLGIKKRVTFLGFVEEKDKADLLASAQIACFPALYGESFGIVLIEAMAAGAGVVIGGNNPGYTSVLQEQPECLFDPRSTAEFADRLHSLLNEPSAAARLHSWQARHVRQYDISVVGQRLEQIYRAAIANKTISRHN